MTSSCETRPLTGSGKRASPQGPASGLPEFHGQEDPMTTLSRTLGRAAAVTTTLIIATACSQLGQLGSVLGTGTPQASQVSGTVQSVDTRGQQIVLQQSNGQSIGLLFDSQTQVTYQNRSYSV